MAAGGRRRRGRRRDDAHDGDAHDGDPEGRSDGDPDGDAPTVESIDLHGRRSDDARHQVELAVHRARVRGATELVVITGRGWGNAASEPVLRTRIEEWTRGADARARGVLGFERAHKGGALRLRLKPRS